jgi:hypothetical protein
VEDRVQGLDRHGAPISPKPIPEIIAGGTALLVSMFINDDLVYTAGSGEQARVSISLETLKVAQRTVQRALDVFEWTGPPIISPS